MTKAKRYLVTAVLWFLFTLVLLTLPGSVLPHENWLDKIWVDKWVHIILFAILVILWSMAFKGRESEILNLKKIFLLIMLSGIIYGVGMEFIQKYFIPNRSFDVGDIIADVIGCLTGFMFSSKRYIKK